MQSEAGTLLIEGGAVNESQLQQALTATVAGGGTLIQNLIRLGFASDNQLASFFSGQMQIPLAESTQFDNLPAFITRLVPNNLVMAHRTVPIMLHQGVLHMAMSDPTNRAALEEISFTTGYSASPVAAPDNLVEAAMARYYGIPPDERIPVLESLPAPTAPLIQGGSYSNSVEDSGTFAQGPASEELEGLFGTGRGQEAVIQLTPSKKVETGTTITDAIRLQVDRESASSGQPAPEQEPSSIWETALPQEPAFEQAPERIVDAFSSPPQGPDTRVTQAPSEAEPELDVDIIVVETEEPETTPAFRQEEPAPSSKDELRPLRDSEEARYLIGQASDRDEVARTLVRYAYAFMPRVVLFIVKKDIMVGWMGVGKGISSQQVKGIMIPLNSPSVFRTVRETGTDYFGSLPRTTVNDIFLAALGDVRPRQILLIPVTVRHKPICILYGDCGTEPGFSKDLSGIHLIAQDASSAFEKIILDRKMNRLINL